MARKNYSVDEVLKTLKKKNDCRIDSNRKVISILTGRIWDKKSQSFVSNPKKKHDLGNKSWGKIDFLTHYNGYVTISATTF